MKEAFAVLCSVVLSACSGDHPPDSATTHLIVERARVSMGSEVRLTAWTADTPRALRAFERGFDEFDRLDRLHSVWKPESDVSRVNAQAGIAPVKVSSETLEVLRVAREVSDWTGGKFDVTFGALSGLWKFDQDQDNQIPRPEDVRARLPLINFQDVQVDPAAGTVFLRRAGMRMHFGGIGKGYAVDRTAAILRTEGIGDFLIQAGGDLYASGRRGDRAWSAGIRDPRGPADQIFARMDLRDETFSTSGDYERYFMVHGRRYHHILDPDVGEPARGCRSVTIVAKQATLADALSTGVFVLGPQAGMALIEKLPDVEGVIVTDRNAVLVSSGLTGRLERVRMPTDAP
jgi:thiamine biosynthesis lipoprotein